MLFEVVLNIPANFILAEERKNERRCLYAFSAKKKSMNKNPKYHRIAQANCDHTNAQTHVIQWGELKVNHSFW